MILMTHYLRALALAALLALPLRAAEIMPAGVIGNSGVEGPSLLRTNIDTAGAQGEGRAFIDSRSPSGAWIDPQSGLWIGYRNAINNISLGGRLVERHPLVPPNAVIDGNYFTALDGTLYFFAHNPPASKGGDLALFALPMKPGAQADVFVKIPEIPSIKSPVLCPQPVDGKIMLGLYREKGIDIALLDPATQDISVLFSLDDGEDLKGLAYDKAKGLVFIGGYFGRKDPARHGHPTVYELICTDLQGNPKWRCGEYFMEGIGANDYQGVLALAGGALWDSSWTGLFGRRNLDGEPAPGKLSFERKIDYSTQFLDVREALGRPAGGKGKELMFVASYDYASMYFGVWDKSAGKFDLLRRIGCLPGIRSLNLGPDGRISLSCIRYSWSTWVLEYSQYWWTWDAAPDAPPAEAGFQSGLTNGYYDKDGNLVVLRNPYPYNDPEMLVLKPGGTIHPLGSLPFKTPAGLAATAIGGKPFAFATDSESKSLWKCALSRDGKPSAPWEKVEIPGAALQQPGDVAVLRDGVLALADNGRALILDVSGGETKLVKTLQKWGARPDQAFGAKISLAADAGTLAVSDSDRQRVLVFQGPDLTCAAGFGQTDQAGDDLFHLSNPGKVAIRGEKIAIADYGNQRVLKCILKP